MLSWSKRLWVRWFSKPPKLYRIAIISDTHNQHEKVKLPDGPIDLIVHCGDFTNRGTEAEALEFLHWYSVLPVPRKILVPGNHEYPLRKTLDALLFNFPRITFLNGRSEVVDDIKIYGTEGYDPFTLDAPVDILITHYPPLGILDKNDKFIESGLEHVRDLVTANKIPYHFFGHVHQSAGISKTNNTTYVNAAFLDSRVVQTMTIETSSGASL